MICQARTDQEGWRPKHGWTRREAGAREKFSNQRSCVGELVGELEEHAKEMGALLDRLRGATRGGGA